MSDKTRVRIVGAIIAVVSPAVVWSVWVCAFANPEWFYGHWQLVCLVMAAAIVLVVAGIAVMFRADQSPTVRTTATIIAVLMALTPIAANAAEGDSPTGSVSLDYTLRGFYNVWTWFTSNIVDISQAITTSNQPQPQGMANNIGGTMIAAPSGPQGSPGGEGRFRSHEK